MIGTVLIVVGGLLAVGAMLGALYVFGLRAKSPLVQGSLIWFTKHVMNPRQMHTAGQPGAYAGIIRTVGRRTGQAYQTPVGIVADGDDFVITLPYGTRPQWLRNVLAAGSATIVHEGQTVEVDRPELVPTAEVQGCFSPADQRANRIFDVDRCLRLRRAAPAASPEATPERMPGAPAETLPEMRPSAVRA